jgi:hypothetical protein
MKIAFLIWGTVGLLYKIVAGFTSFVSTAVHEYSAIQLTQLAAQETATSMIWIGGMLFFGLGALIGRSKIDEPRVSHSNPLTTDEIIDAIIERPAGKVSEPVEPLFFRAREQDTRRK